MGKKKGKKKKGGKKVRVTFRRNRSSKVRDKSWTDQAREAQDNEVDAIDSEQVQAKGDISRHRTIIVHDDPTLAHAHLHSGVVLAMRGLYAEVDDGQKIHACTIRRILRTQKIDERNPVTVGDRVRFSLGSSGDAKLREGVIEHVDPRLGQLRRKSGRRIHTVVANVDQAIIVSSAGQPAPKPQLIDRYIIAALAGEITPIICMNKIDLDEDSQAEQLLLRYENLGYETLATCATSGQGIEKLRALLKDKESVVAGQSGVGKSSLLNAAEPGLTLRTSNVGVQNEKGRHTTTTASLIRLKNGGYVVDTPGIRSFDISLVPRSEFEVHFVEFVPHVANCRYPDCTHTHENECAVKKAVEQGHIHPARYASYVDIFEEPGIAP